MFFLEKMAPLEYFWLIISCDCELMNPAVPLELSATPVLMLSSADNRQPFQISRELKMRARTLYTATMNGYQIPLTRRKDKRIPCRSDYETFCRIVRERARKNSYAYPHYQR
jgi:hypothetical protein